MRAISCSLILALPMMIGAWELSLLHVNDIHARMEETNKYSSPCTTKDQAKGLCFGGLARIVTAVNKVKNDDQVRQEVFFKQRTKFREAMPPFGSTLVTSSRERFGTQSSSGAWSQR